MAGLKAWIDNLQKSIKEKRAEENNPELQRQKRREDAKKTVERGVTAIKLAQGAIEKYNRASKRVGDISEAMTNKTLEIAEKVRPAAEKIDETASVVGEKLKGAVDATLQGTKDAYDATKGTVGKTVEKVTGALTRKKDDGVTEEKPVEVKEVKVAVQKPKNPTTGSSLLDMLAPAVPETDATRPKQPKL